MGRAGRTAPLLFPNTKMLQGGAHSEACDKNWEQWWKRAELLAGLGLWDRKV